MLLQLGGRPIQFLHLDLGLKQRSILGVLLDRHLPDEARQDGPQLHSQPLSGGQKYGQDHCQLRLLQTGRNYGKYYAKSSKVRPLCNQVKTLPQFYLNLKYDQS